MQLCYLKQISNQGEELHQYCCQVPLWWYSVLNVLA